MSKVGYLWSILCEIWDCVFVLPCLVWNLCITCLGPGILLFILFYVKGLVFHNLSCLIFANYHVKNWIFMFSTENILVWVSIFPIWCEVWYASACLKPCLGQSMLRGYFFFFTIIYLFRACVVWVCLFEMLLLWCLV